MSIREYDHKSDNLLSEIAVGCVCGNRSKYWMDGMEDEYAIFYNAETDELEEKQVGYYGCDGCNLMGMSFNIDITLDNARKAMRCLKRMALSDYAYHLRKLNESFGKGDVVKVVRGRKVPKGSILEVFWCGEKYNMYKRTNEMLIGAYNKDGDKVWVLAEYCQHIKPKTESPKVRKEWIKEKTIDLSRNMEYRGIYHKIMEVVK